MTIPQRNYLDNLNEWGIERQIGVEDFLGKGWRERWKEIPEEEAQEAISKMNEKLRYKRKEESDGTNQDPSRSGNQRRS